jgi:hypothetical protein
VSAKNKIKQSDTYRGSQCVCLELTHATAQEVCIAALKRRRNRERKNMKTKNKLNLLAMTAAVLSLSAATGVGQVFSPEDAINNRAVAASPRAKEAFPWLTRTAVPRTDACCDKGEVKNELTEAKKNRAHAASPRVRELFPELAREAAPEREFTIAVIADAPDAATKNRAWANSPRVREEFPALSRGVMEKGSAKGGASRLMEFGK